MLTRSDQNAASGRFITDSSAIRVTGRAAFVLRPVSDRPSARDREPIVPRRMADPTKPLEPSEGSELQ